MLQYGDNQWSWAHSQCEGGGRCEVISITPLCRSIFYSPVPGLPFRTASPSWIQVMKVKWVVRRKNCEVEMGMDLKFRCLVFLFFCQTSLALVNSQVQLCLFMCFHSYYCHRLQIHNFLVAVTASQHFP